jgi:23S rRNA (uracil1939-C5)-methyltransferase
MARVIIESLGQRGEGIAELDGRRVFVPFTVPGDQVEIGEVADDHAFPSEIVVAGHGRAQSICPHFTLCGGCQLQHLDPATYAAFKRGLVVTALSYAGMEAPVAGLVDATGEGRRRATLHARKEGAGYMIQRSHDLYAIDHCPILVTALKQAPEIARGAFDAVGPCDVHLTATLYGLDVTVWPETRVRPERLTQLGRRFRVGRISLGRELVLQNSMPAVRMGKALVEIPPASFLQATTAAEETLAGLVTAGLRESKSVADLFCGVGPFALRLAENAKVSAFDNDKAAIASLQKAVRSTQGLKPVVSAYRDLFREPLTAIELREFDGLVFDPPRAGAEEQAKEVATSGVKSVVAVSCDPTTFARDAKILVDGGYRLVTVTPVDQFAWSTHVEIVGVFRR